MRIDELKFDLIKDIEYSQKSPSYAEAEIRGIKYVFAAQRFGPGNYNLAFAIKPGQTVNGEPINMSNFDRILTKTKDSLKVFSAFKKFIDNFVKEEDPKMVVFSARDEKRARLYEKVIKIFKPSEWDIEKRDKIMGMTGHFFVLTKTE